VLTPCGGSLSGRSPDRNPGDEQVWREPGALRQATAAVVDRVACWRSAWNRTAATSAPARSSRHIPRKSSRSRWFILERSGYDMTCRESALTAIALDARGVMLWVGTRMAIARVGFMELVEVGLRLG
jgi:hypothetical protein